MFIVLLYFLFSIILILLIQSYVKRDLGNIFRRPIVLTLGGLLIIHGLLPPFQYITNIYRYSQGYSAWSHIYSIFLAVLYIAFLVLFYSISFRKNYPLPQYFLPMSMSGKMFFILFLAIPAFLGSSLFFLRIYSIGYSAYITDRVGFTDRYGGWGLLTSRWLYITFIVFSAGYFSSGKRDKGMLLGMIGMGIFMTAYFSYLASRNDLFIAFMGLSGVYFMTHSGQVFSFKRILFSKAGMITISLITGMVVIGELRSYHAGAGTQGSVFDSVVYTFNDAFGNHENINWMIDNDFEYQYGKTYLAGFVVVYPRVFWPNKPLGAGPLMKNLVDPGSYEVGRSGISSVTTGMINEAYINGGLVGVVLLGALNGVFIKYISICRSKCRGVWSISFYNYSLVIFAYALTYGEFVGIYSRWIVDIVPLLLGCFLFELRKPYYEPIYDDYLPDAEEEYASK